MGSFCRQTSPSCRIVASLICRNGLKRCSLHVRPYVSQFAESLSAPINLASSICAVASCTAQPIAVLPCDVIAPALHSQVLGRSIRPLGKEPVFRRPRSGGHEYR